MQVATTVAEVDHAMAQMRTELTTQIDENTAKITQVSTAVTEVDKAMAQMGQGLHAEIETNKTAIAKNTADIQIVSTAVAKVDQSVADLGTDLRAQIGNNTAAISEKLTAMVDSDGSSSIYTLKVGVKYNGQEVLAGMSVAAIAQPGKPPVARVAFNAEEFVLLSGRDDKLFSPFAVKGGQAFITDAFIQDASIDGVKIKDATIDMAKISDTIQSTNFSVTDKTGWQLNKTGGSVFYGTVYASHIEGDLSVTYAMPPLYLTGLSGSGSRTVTWAGGVDFDVRISIPFFQFNIVNAVGVFRARVTIGGQAINGVGFTNGWFQSDQTIKLGTTGYVDIPANTVDVPIKVEWGVAPGSSPSNAALMFSGMSIIVSPKRDRFT
ncbi:DUF1983 domain-containing protein [Kluyvera sichuanensis]|uniref:phage tail tip fiber protein n=1 Tax=Kluyvera sichuanensis TaxID=2725494 RepID=UPI0039F6C6C3